MARADRRRPLFLYTGNACRSQRAEGWTRHLKGDQIEPYSLGIAPRAPDPRAVRVMAEAGVDISGHRSKPLDELPQVDFDYVVTVCDHAREACPVFPGRTRMVHVGFDDPPPGRGGRERGGGPRALPPRPRRDPRLRRDPARRAEGRLKRLWMGRPLLLSPMPWQRFRPSVGPSPLVRISLPPSGRSG